NTVAAPNDRSRRGGRRKVAATDFIEDAQHNCPSLPIPIDGFNLAPGPSLETVQHGTGGLSPTPRAAGADTRQRRIAPRRHAPLRRVPPPGRRAEPDHWPGGTARKGGREEGTRASAGAPLAPRTDGAPSTQ